MPRLDQLKVLRRRNALSQQELAKRAGISRSAIARIETGQEDARPTTIRRLAAALDVGPETLAGVRSDAAQLFRNHPELAALVGEAAREIGEHMPAARLSLRVESDPEYGDEQVVLEISTDLPEDQATEALRRFDRGWWVKNVPRARGRLCIDVLGA